MWRWNSYEINKRGIRMKQRKMYKPVTLEESEKRFNTWLLKKKLKLKRKLKRNEN